jgi:hypothetical protein
MARGDTSEAVRDLAEELGVSERTAWRRLAAMRAARSRAPLERGQVCDWCRRRLPKGATIRRRFCDGCCRAAKHRHPDETRDSLARKRQSPLPNGR